MKTVIVRGRDVGRRLPWLLVFRVAVASSLLALTLAADLLGWPLKHVSFLLYGVVIGTYVTVAILGLALRAGFSPVIISAVHLATAVMATLMIVHGTGGVRSLFSFFYLLAILDGSIIGGRTVALVTAAASALTHGGHLVAQVYGLVSPGPDPLPPPSTFTATAFVHVAGFFLAALLAGHLAEQLERARRAVSDARTDLAWAEATHAEVVESLPLGVLTLSSAGRILSSNRKAREILGGVDVGRGAVLPPALGPLLAEPEWHSREETVVLGGRRCELYLARSDLGGPVPRGSDGPKVLVLEDRTELRSLERDLAAKERLASIGGLAAAIAHEIRNPLASLSGSIELMTNPSLEGPARDKLHDIVLREIERLNELIRDFLLYARPTPPQRTSVDVAQLARDVCEILSRGEAQDRHEILVDAPDALVASVDPGQLRQVLWNLIRNAVEASPEGRPVRVAVHRDGTDLCVDIRDEGEGIPDEIQAHLFEPFQTTKEEGSGLGLAVVHRIVDVHDGTIAVESSPGEGTLFRVVLRDAVPAGVSAAS